MRSSSIRMTALAAAAVLAAGALSYAQTAPPPDNLNNLDYRTSQSMATYRAPVYPDDVYVRTPLPASEQAYKDINGLHIKFPKAADYENTVKAQFASVGK